MTKQMIEHYIEVLKIKENRFFCGIAVSCLLDIVLAAFYFIQAVGSGGNLWLIAFSLLFTNLITIYGWDADNDLILSNILQGQAIGLIILATGINLLLKSAKMCNQSKPLV